MSLDTTRKNALSLVEALWDSLDWQSIPQRMRPAIYEHFQNWIQSSAYTGNLQNFLNQFLENAIASTVPEPWITVVNHLLQNANDAEVLSVLREETAALIIMMRARKEIPREAKKAEFLARLSPEEKAQIEKYEKMKQKEVKKHDRNV